MSKTIQLVYNDHAGCYTSLEQYQHDQMRSMQLLETESTPILTQTQTSDIFKNIIRLSPVIACVILGNVLPLALYVLPLLSVAANPNKKGTMPASKGRRRKGRTDLPLYDIAEGCMSTRCNE